MPNTLYALYSDKSARYCPDSVGGPCITFSSPDDATAFRDVQVALKRLKKKDRWEVVKLRPPGQQALFGEVQENY